MNAKNVRSYARPTQSGMSMVEILVTLTIVAFGLLGLLGLQARALTFQKDSFNRKSAAEMVAQLAERMRANHLGFVSGNYDFDFSAAAADPAVINECATITACTWKRLLHETSASGPPSYVVAFLYRRPTSISIRQSTTGWSRWRWHGRSRRKQAPLATPGTDAICDDLNARFGAGLNATYRCYRTFIFP